MAFAAVPEESKKQINKAGAILTLINPSQAELSWAVGLADRWRACHAYPINTFQATLRTKLRAYGGDPIAAQRLKRMPTIIDKLKRYPNMKLTTMQDIGGVRAILNSVRDVYRLSGEYRDSIRFPHELVDQKDYLQNPRDEDGYRSIHLIYRYRNSQAKDYNGLRIELQIRTRLQHTWATAVETMGTLLGQALKSRLGDREWLDFFALISSIFAIDERYPTPPRFNGRSREDLSASVASLEASLDALTLMRGLSVAANEIYKDDSRKGWSYHLIILNSLKRTLQIKPYDRDSLDQALADYASIEAEAAKGEKIEPVLVSAGPMQKLRRAYPNFFLDINEFGKKVKKICTDARK
ncbi:MAG: RelA/SpoT domain-containing protein [Thermodesulfobacteriota bacterium]|nr:RelA/SpoT domain-containing protein [Thermodesulfobacteriota bacterium]